MMPISLQIIGVVALWVAVLYVVAAACDVAARGRTLLAASATAGLVALGAIGQGLSEYSNLALAVAVVAVVTAVVGTVVQSAGARRGGSRLRAPWAAITLTITRLGLLALFVVGAGFTLAGGGVERKLDDRVTIEKGWLEPGSIVGKTYEERAGKWHPEMVRLQLFIETPRAASICPIEPVKVDEDAGGTTYVERPSKCAARREVMASYGGEPVSVTVYKLIVDPPAAVGRRIDALIGLGWLLLVLAGLCVERILSAAVRGQPFAMSNVRWLRALAAAAAGLMVGVPLLVDRLVAQLVEEFLPQLPPQGWSVSLWPLLVVALLLALAEIWRYGIRLQEADEATV